MNYKEAITSIRTMVLAAVKDRDITAHDELLECTGDADGVVRAVETLCKMIELKGVELYVETGESLWQWGMIDDDGLTSMSYGECKLARSHLDIAAHTLVTALSYVRGGYGKYELYVIGAGYEESVLNLAEPQTQIEEELAQLVDELNLVVYTGSQNQVQGALKEIAAK